MCFEFLLKCRALGKFVIVVVDDLSSLFLRVLLSRNFLVCCKPFYVSISIKLKELLGFSSSIFGGFSHGISCLMWMNDSFH